VYKVLQDLQELLASKEQLDRQVSRVSKALREPQACKVQLGPQVFKELPVLQACRVLLVPPDSKVRLELQVFRALSVIRALRALPVSLASRDHKVAQALREFREQPAQQDYKAAQEPLVFKVNRA
jgi:hypothetical protein